MSLNISIFKKTQYELNELNKFIVNDNTYDFWGYEDIISSLDIEGTVLFYLAGNDNIWRGVLLVRQSDDCVEIFYIFVSDVCRGKGYASLLMKEFIQYFKSISGVKRVFLEVRSSNSSAIKFYKNWEFTLEGTRKKYYKDGEDALIFKKEL